MTAVDWLSTAIASARWFQSAVGGKNGRAQLLPECVPESPPALASARGEPEDELEPDDPVEPEDELEVDDELEPDEELEAEDPPEPDDALELAEPLDPAVPDDPPDATPPPEDPSPCVAPPDPPDPASPAQPPAVVPLPPPHASTVRRTAKMPDACTPRISIQLARNPTCDEVD